jgi:hypothetical protein
MKVRACLTPVLKSGRIELQGLAGNTEHTLTLTQAEAFAETILAQVKEGRLAFQHNRGNKPRRLRVLPR